MIPILVQDISTSFPHFRKGPLVTQGNVVDHKSLSTKMFVHSVVLSLLIFVAGISAFRFPSPFLRSSILILNDVPPRLSPFGGGELKSNENEVVNEKTDHIEQSGLLLADASDWGIKTALAEEHIALGNFDEAVKLAREAMAIADHVRQPDSIYHAYAEGILGDAYYKNKAYQAAANCYHSALKAYERHYRSESGPESIELMGATQLVAWNLLNQREFREATQAWSSALGITERVLGGPNHTDVAACMTNLAVSHMNLGDIGPAPEALLLKALSVFEHDQMVFLDQNEHEEFQPFKTKRPEPIASVNTIIGHLYFQRRDDEKAAEKYQRVVDMYEAGTIDGFLALPALQQLGVLKWHQDMKKVAEELFESAVALRELSLSSVKEKSKKDQVALNELRQMLANLRRGDAPPSRLTAQTTTAPQMRTSEEGSTGC